MALPPAERTTPPPLLPTFALLGLIGGWISGFHFLRTWHVPADDGRRLHGLFVIFAGAAMAAVGVLVERALDRRRAVSSLVAFTIASLALGAVTGGAIALVYALTGGSVEVYGDVREVGVGEGLLVGVFHGLAYALAFLPGFGATMAVGLRVGRARPGSAVDASDRRAVWLTGALVASVASCLASFLAPASAASTHALALVCVGAIATVFMMDLRSLERLASTRIHASDMPVNPAHLQHAPTSKRVTLLSIDNYAEARRDLLRALLVDGLAFVASASVLLGVLRMKG